VAPDAASVPAGEPGEVDDPDGLDDPDASDVMGDPAFPFRSLFRFPLLCRLLFPI
jgi:hypothetical protein